jgi:FkbM family methyltransferase
VLPTPAPTLDGALDRLRHRNIEVSTVVDVGASDGRWSAEMMRVYPKAAYLLIEANEVHEPALARFRERHPNVQYTIAAASDSVGEVYFDGSDAFGGVASVEEIPGFVSMRATTIDAAAKGLHAPFLIKLDTHGHEVPILNGGANTIAQASALVVECYNFQVTPEALRFHEMCDFLGRRGFRCIDAFDLMYRPGDGAFWQMDLLFVRETRREFETSTYA